VRWLLLIVLGDVLTVQGGWCVGYFCLCLVTFLQCKVDGALVTSVCVR
jgi:hypothetical protein